MLHKKIKKIMSMLLFVVANIITFESVQSIELKEQLLSLSAKLDSLKNKLSGLELNLSNLKKNLSKNIYLSLVHGDMTKQKFADYKTAAIVNAANTVMRGGGGIDGSIHGAAGNELLEHEKNKNLSGVTGGAILTPSFNLEKNKICSKIIHAVGPLGSDANRENLLTNAYRNSLQIAYDNNLTAIAFPAISTAIFGYNINEATPVALNAVINFLTEHKATTSLQEVRFVVFSVDDYNVYKQKLQAKGYAPDTAEPALDYHNASNVSGIGVPQPPLRWRFK